MPYIDERLREYWEEWLNGVPLGPASPGEINYIITKLLLDWLGQDPRYEDYNAVIGVLECIKLELYRRAVAPYEDKKCKDNGDVF